MFPSHFPLSFLFCVEEFFLRETRSWILAASSTKPESRSKAASICFLICSATCRERRLVDPNPEEGGGSRRRRSLTLFCRDADVVCSPLFLTGRMGKGRKRQGEGRGGSSLLTFPRVHLLVLHTLTASCRVSNYVIRLTFPSQLFLFFLLGRFTNAAIGGRLRDTF